MPTKPENQKQFENQLDVARLNVEALTATNEQLSTLVYAAIELLRLDYEKANNVGNVLLDKVLELVTPTIQTIETDDA